ncbi:MAG: TrbC/VirB2 family protein [Anaerolineales bacterium]|nr:TrbC/VirB2 family protein [Anaerolineales bacterium]
MDNLLYSVTPLQAFSGSIAGVVIMFILGLGLPILAIFNRKDSIWKKLGNILLGLFILLSGFLLMYGSYRQYQGGDKTTLVQVLEKNEVRNWCKNHFCTDYVIETSDSQKRYVFDLKKDVWNEIELASCYRFTYYPIKPLLAEYLKDGDTSPDLYETTGDITRIEKVNCP